MEITNLLTALDLNTREIALGLWLLIICVFVISNEKFRNSFARVFRTASEAVIFLPLIGLVIYTTAITYLLQRLSLWDVPNIKDTAIWFFGVGLVMFVKANDAKEPVYYRNLIKDIIKMIAGLSILEFLLNLYTFSFWVEMVLVPVMFLLGGMLAVAIANPKYKQVKDLLFNLIGAIGLGLLAFLAYKLLTDLSSLMNIGALREFLLPAIYTTSILPYIFVLALYLVYNGIFRLMGYYAGSDGNTYVNKLRILFAFNFNLGALRNWQRFVAVQRVKNPVDIRDSIRKFKAGERI